MGGGEGKLPYTHQVTCQLIQGSPKGFGAGNSSDISPSSVDNINILSLQTAEGQSNTSLISTNEIQNNYYIARSDTGEYFGQSSFGNLYRIYWLKSVFNESDVGKTIPIWLANTPPPGFSLKSANEASFKREAVC